MKFLLLLLIPFYSQALEFSSYVDKTEVGLNESFTLKLEFRSNSKFVKNIEAPSVYQVKDFDFLGEFQSQQSSISIVNNQMTQTKILVKSYRLQAKSLGDFTIAPLTVKAGGKSFTTQAFKIKVLANKKPSSSRNQAPSLFQGLNRLDPFRLSPHSLFDFPKRRHINKSDFKFKLELSKDHVYKFEPIRADWYLLYTSRLPRFELIPFSSLQGFWIEDILNKTSTTGSQAVGKTLYRKLSVKSVWLFPLKSGEFTVKAHKLKIAPTFSLYSDFISSKAKKVSVKNLPTNGLDSTFTGAVGNFKVEFSVKETEVTLDQPFSLKITFTGSGHPRFIHLPQLDFPNSVEVYDPVKKSKFIKKGVGTKEFEILVLPKKKGLLILPSFSLTTFNPFTGQYVVHKSPIFNLIVKKGSVQDSMSQTYFNPVEKEAQTLTPIASFYWPGFINFDNIYFGFEIFFVLCMLSLFLIWFKNRISNKKLSRNGKIKQKLSKIEKFLKKEDWQSACIDMIQLGIYVLAFSEIKELSSSHWRQTLKGLPPSLSKKYYKEFEKLFLELESFSFSSQSQTRDLAVQKAKHFFNQIKFLVYRFLADI